MPRSAPAVSLPPWVTTDWPLVGLCVLVMLGALFATCAAYGALLSIVTGGGFGAVIDGVTTGLYLPFAAFGAKTTVTSGPDLPSVLLAFQFLPLPLGVTGVVATWLALRFAGTRLVADRSSLLAFAAKLAVTFGIVMGVLASVLSIGDIRTQDGFTAKVSGGEAWIYSTVIVALAALVFLRMRGVRLLPARVAVPGVDLLPYAVDGAKAFGLLALGMTPVALIAAIIAVDTAGQRLGVLFGLLGAGLTMGIVGAAYAMGAAVALIGGHTSLLKFGFPPSSDAGAAPFPFFILVLVAPAIVAWVVYRRLEHERPATEQDAIKTGFTTAIAFALTAWLGVLVSRVNLVAVIGKDDGDGVGAVLTAKPSPGAVLGLALVWGLAGGLGMALYWARQQGAGWRMGRPLDSRAYDNAGFTTAGAGAEADAAFRANDWGQGASEPACRSCGTELGVGSRFCPRCGTPV